MLPTVTTQDDYITALVDALLALAADDASVLSGVEITSAPLSLEDSLPDAIAVLDTNGSETWYGIGNYRRDEDYTVNMAVLVIRPGSDEAAIRAARGRAFTLHNAVAEYVRRNPKLGTLARVSEISGVDLGQGYHRGDTAVRWARLDWSIHVEAQIEVV